MATGASCLASGRLERKAANLFLEQTSIRSATAQQFGVGAGFYDIAAVKHDYQIGVYRTAQAMGDQKNRSPFHQALHRFMDQVFRFRIDCRGRFVEDYNLGILEESARKREPLALAAGNFHSALADHRVDSGGQIFDELAHIGQLERLPEHLLRGIRARVEQVVADAGAK